MKIIGVSTASPVLHILVVHIFLEWKPSTRKLKKLRLIIKILGTMITHLHNERTIEQSHISNVCVLYYLPMRWICVYCNKIMDSTNFTDFIRDSDNKDAEYHGWQHIHSEDYPSYPCPIKTAAIQLYEN